MIFSNNHSSSYAGANVFYADGENLGKTEIKYIFMGVIVLCFYIRNFMFCREIMKNLFLFPGRMKSDKKRVMVFSHPFFFSLLTNECVKISC